MKKFNSEADFVSPVGLVVAACMLIITLTIGTLSYRHGLDAGRYDAAHDSWNVGYQLGWNDGYLDGRHQCP